MESQNTQHNLVDILYQAQNDDYIHRQELLNVYHCTLLSLSRLSPNIRKEKKSTQNCTCKNLKSNLTPSLIY